MADFIRDSTVGQFIRLVTHNRILLYPEERPDFQCPASYSNPDEAAKAQRSGLTSQNTTHTSINKDNLEKEDLSNSDQESADGIVSTNPTDLERGPANNGDLARMATLEKEPTQPIIPQRTKEGDILVDWYTEGDKENPQNWSFGYKIMTTALICLYTMAVYMGSSIITSSTEGIMRQFHVGATAASLTLALYTLAYGLGPLIFSPLSEIPVIGRNPPYIITMFIFVVLIVPTALVDNFAGLLVLRFLLGFFGSPCLATGGASLGDMWSFIKLPYLLCIWAFAATCGPALGPLISGFSVAAENWRWSLWEMLWLAGPVFAAMLFLPETSSANILLRRAKRLRKLTGNNNLKSQSEIDQAKMTPKDVAFEALVRPIQLMIMDPAIGFTALYTALCYGIYYSFFEAFPLVYVNMYGFNLGQLGLTFLSITVGVLVSIAMFWSYLYFYLEPKIMKVGFGAPEERLLPALIASFLCPAGLFIFGWTSNPDIYWIVSVVGIFIFTIGIFIIMQCIFVYLPMVYPQYAASLFAGNDFARSTLAFAAVLFSRPMYINLGIGPGCSLLGGLTAGCIVGVFALYFFGAKLRARSRFAAK